MTKPPKKAVDAGSPATPSAPEIEAILAGTHSDPFSVLGVQQAKSGFVARCFIPGAETVVALALDGTPIGTLACLHPAGFFVGPISITGFQPVRYRAATR